MNLPAHPVARAATRSGTVVDSAPASRPAARSAFAAHGIWTPGVLLMRNLPFVPKMLLLVSLICVALGLLAAAYYRTMLGNIGFSALERDGVHVLQRLYPALHAALDTRRDATVAAAGSTNAAVPASNQALQQALDQLGDALARYPTWRASATALTQAQQAIAQATVTPGDVSATFASYSRGPQALIALAAAVCDDSNLTLDPEVHTYYIMDAVCFRLPDIVERVGAMQGLGGGVLRSQSLPRAVAESLVQHDAIVAYHIDSATAGLAKTVRDRPELQDRLGWEPVREAVLTMVRRMEDDIVHAEQLEAQRAAAYVAVGNDALQRLNAVATQQLALLDELLAERVGGMQRQMLWMSVAIVLVLLLVVYFVYAFFVVNRGGTAIIQHHLRLMAQGDLREPPPKPWGRDEPAHIVADLRVAYDSLHTLIRKVRHAARDLANASEEIAHASRDLGARTEAAAATLEQQASAMEQIGSQVGSTAQRAHEAADFSQHNAALASSSRSVVNSVVGTMRDIQGSSQKIADIIGVIDGIAFQTNILALNAAVEAARAGEAGRGFAVVAGEVRALAQCSAEAARQIKALIDESVTKVRSGVAVVEQAGSTMGSLVQNAETINGYMVDIAAAAREQAAGVEQSVQAIQQLDASTQQNAALVEQTSAAGSALEQQAERLMDEIARFKL